MSNKSYIKAIFKNIKLNFTRNILIAALAFISSIIYARALGPELYGEYIYIIWLTETAVVIIALGVPGTITKFMPEYYYKQNYKYSYYFYKTINSVFIIWGAFVVLILGVTSSYWINYTSLTSDNKFILLILACIAILPSLLNTISTSFIQSIRMFDYYAKINVVAQLLLILVNIIVVLSVKNILYMIFMLMFINLTQFFAYDVYIKKNIPKDFINRRIKDFEDKTRIIKYSVSMYINTIWQQIVWTRSEFFFLGLYSSSKDIAIYGLAYSLNAIINTIFNPIINVLVNHFSELVSKKEVDFLNFLIFYATKYFNLILVPIFFIALNFYKPLLTLVYSESYNGVSDIFPLLFFSTIFSVTLSIGNSIPFYYEKQRFIIIMGIIVGLLNILSDILLIPDYGYLGAAIANTISQMIFTLIAFTYNIKSFGIKYPIKFLIFSNILGVVLFLPGILVVESIILKAIYIVIALVLYFLFLRVLRLFDSVDKENYQRLFNILKNIRS